MYAEIKILKDFKLKQVSCISFILKRQNCIREPKRHIQNSHDLFNRKDSLCSL